MSLGDKIKNYNAEDFNYEKSKSVRFKSVYIPQHDQLDCGAAVLAMVSASLGNPIHISQFRDILDIGSDGSTLLGLVYAAEKVGLKCSVIEYDWDLLQELQPPMICLVSNSEIAPSSIDHFVVVYRVSYDSVWIADPSFGKVKKSKVEFLSSTKNMVLMFNTTPDFFSFRSPEPYRLSLFSLVKGNYKATGGILLASLIGSGIGLLPPMLTGRFFDLLMAQKFDDLHSLLFLLLMLAIVTPVISLVRDYLVMRLGVILNFKLSTRLKKKILGLPYRAFNSRGTGDYLSRMDGLGHVESFLSEILVGLLIDVSMALMYLGALFWIDAKFGAIALAAGITLVVFLLFFSNWMKSRIHGLIVELGAINTILIENIRSFRTLKLMGAEIYYMRIWKEKLKNWSSPVSVDGFKPQTYPA